MLKVGLLGAVLVAGCSTAPAGPVVHGVTPGHRCVARGTDHFIGQPGNSDTGAAIRNETHAAVLRWAPPGYMLTMDYREDRVTVRLSPDRKVTAINCG
jgi:hypothetical protein